MNDKVINVMIKGMDRVPWRTLIKKMRRDKV